MSKGKKTLLVVAALVVLVVGGYKWRYPTYAWHQKLTIEVDTPDGVKSGSSVVAVSWSEVPQFLPDVILFQTKSSVKQQWLILAMENICLRC